MEDFADEIILEKFGAIADGFYDRVRLGPRDLTRIHQITHIPYNTLQMWGAARKGKNANVPDIYKALIIAQAQGVSPAWLAWNLGPADPVAARDALDFGATLAGNHGLAIVIRAYIRGDAEDQSTLRQIAKRIPGAVEYDVQKNLITDIADPKRVKTRRAKTPPAKTDNLQITVDHDAQTVAYSVSEPPAVYGDPLARIPDARPIENKKMPRNTRSDFPVFHALKNQTNPFARRPVPRFLQLAAGPGRELERCDDIHSFREYVPHGVHAARVQGYSMLNTVRHGETCYSNRSMKVKA